MPSVDRVPVKTPHNLRPMPQKDFCNTICQSATSRTIETDFNHFLIQPSFVEGEIAAPLPWRLQSAYFVSTVTFSVKLHKLHSKVRTSRPSGPETIPVNIIGIGPWYLGHGARLISMRPGSAIRDLGMCCPPKSRREYK